MKNLLTAISLFISISMSAQYSSLTPQKPLPLPADIKTAVLNTVVENEGSNLARFKTRQDIANGVYFVAILLAAAGMISEDTSSSFYYAPAGLWAAGFIIDRSSYYLIKED